MSEHVDEQAVMLPTAKPWLVGIHARAGGARRPGSVAVILLNAGLMPRSGPNRLYTRMARRLAKLGIDSLRFDLSGIGDSAARSDGQSYRQGALRDVRDALDFLSSTKLYSGFVLVGLCSGADLAMRAALADRRVVGLVQIDGLPYTTFFSRTISELARVRRAVADGRWRQLVWRFSVLTKAVNRIASATSSRQDAERTVVTKVRDAPTLDEARAMLAALSGRHVGMMAVFTEGRGYSHHGQFHHLFPRLDPEDVTVVQIEGADHLFSLASTQNRLLELVADWISRLPSTFTASARQ